MYSKHHGINGLSNTDYAMFKYTEAHEKYVETDRRETWDPVSGLPQVTVFPHLAGRDYICVYRGHPESSVFPVWLRAKKHVRHDDLACPLNLRNRRLGQLLRQALVSGLLFRQITRLQIAQATLDRRVTLPSFRNMISFHDPRLRFCHRGSMLRATPASRPWAFAVSCRLHMDTGFQKHTRSADTKLDLRNT